jgi:2-haloacid dehalogenase
MLLGRREFLHAGLGLSSGMLLNPPVEAEGGHPRFRTVAFDALAIFDLHPVAALTERLFPGHGIDLTGLWRTRQFEYTWLRTVTDRYSDFMQVTADALIFAAKALKLDLSADKRDQLLEAYLQLKTWPDAVPALRSLKRAGANLAILSNFTPGMLSGCIAAAELDDMFGHVLSTDAARTYKPDPRAYKLGIENMKLRREEILFAAFAGWDAAGAKSFGYPTFWVNRLGLPAEELGALPDTTGPDLISLANYVAA